MADPKAFMSLPRVDIPKRPPAERKCDWKEFYRPLPVVTLKEQAARCMDCGVPFCQADTGCPVQNLIPDWNELVREDRWREALVSLHSTNNFPEFTGKLCPAPCEQACVLGIIEEPVTIKGIEMAIIDRGFDEGWVQPQPPLKETGKRVAIVGSGPAGLAAAQNLRRSGHRVTVFEKMDRLGGLLRYGIPDFKMEKPAIDRRLEQMVAEGVVFRTNVEVGRDVALEQLQDAHDAVCLAIGAEDARPMEVPGADLEGVHYAMEYLIQQNRLIAGDPVPEEHRITAQGKHVIIIGGGDTASDCLGTVHRQGAVSVHQFILYPEPGLDRDEATPWPYWPLKLMDSHAHEEGGEREWSVIVTGLSGTDGRVKKLHAIRVEVERVPGARSELTPLPGTEFEFDVDLVLVAIGFVGPTRDDLVDTAGLNVDPRGNLAVDATYRTNLDGVWAAGDAQRGASLIVWAIREGQDAATDIDRWLTA
ncbi:MAG: glutamate synthase small subunit [Gemmatimonas sp.]|nr:glutamate synthase small subunit [Gemmatimonas sp.]